MRDGKVTVKYLLDAKRKKRQKENHTNFSRTFYNIVQRRIFRNFKISLFTRIVLK